MKSTTRSFFFAVAVASVLGFAAAADASIYYYDASGRSNSLSSIEWVRLENSDNNGHVALNDNYPNWYGVDDKTVLITNRISVSGNVNLIIADGCTLTVQGGFHVPEGSSLSIYGQAEGTGELIADAANRFKVAGIGGDEGEAGGTIVICGGKITASGGVWSAGIGGGYGGAGGRIDIHGGTVTATGDASGAGIGGGSSGEGGYITIHGGMVTAIGGDMASGIGGGHDGNAGEITIYGGTVTAQGSQFGPGIGGLANGWIQIVAGTVTATGGEFTAGIGGGGADWGGTIAINGGSVTATGGTAGAGIGGGYKGSGGTITIDGGTVRATSGGDGAGIGGGYKGSGGNITIRGGTVVATSYSGGAGIGGGSGNLGGTITIEGGKVTATGKAGGAGIGGGAKRGANITISGGTVTATGNGVGQAIGAGAEGSPGSLTIQGSMRTSAGPNESEATIAALADRVDACRNYWARVEPCTTHGFHPDGTCSYCGEAYPFYAGETTLAGGWHRVTASTRVETRIEVVGEADLLLDDGVEFVAVQGFHVTGANRLAIWAQSDDRATAGKLTVPVPDGCVAGIGGNDGEAGGTVAVNGGVLDINGGYKSAAIGGGRSGAGGTTTVNGGFVTANGGECGTGLGGGMAVNASVTGGSVGCVTINGGEVTASGGFWSAGIGGGGGSNAENGSSGGTVTINGGTVTAIGDTKAAGIGGSVYSDGCAVQINGGTVTAWRWGYGAAIGGGDDGGDDGDLAINGMRAFASAAATEPVPLADRESVCRSEWVRLVACAHEYDRAGVCPLCGSHAGPVVYLDPADADAPGKVCEGHEDFTGQTELSGGWYVARGETQTTARVEVLGDVHLILCDGAELTAAQGFHVAGTNSLAIWAQGTNRATAGKLTVHVPDGCVAGIGGNDGEAGGTVTVHGGVLDIAGGHKSAAIGGGRCGAGGTTTINGGFVTATGGTWGTGLGGGMAVNADYTSGNAGSITINGGEVTASGGAWSAGIGGAGGTSGGNGSLGGTVRINGGTVAATGGTYGAGIGGGRYGGGVAVKILGGTVTAAAGAGAQAIGDGDGWGGDAGTLAIGDGMRVYASDAAAEPVAATEREGACRGEWTRLEPCTEHPAFDMLGVCLICHLGAGPVPYLDPTDTASPGKVCTGYSNFTGQTELSNGWYVARGLVQAAGRVEVSGDVHLILCDGAELTSAKGFHVTGGNRLTLWAMSTDRTTTGKLSGGTSWENWACIAGIGGNNKEAGGTITINGGFVTAIGSDEGAGIGGGCGGIDGSGGGAGTIRINGGFVTACGGVGGAGIGVGRFGMGGDITIHGGTVAATGGERDDPFGVEPGQAIGYGTDAPSGFGSLDLDGMRVFASESDTEPVAAADRVGVCNSHYARLDVCPHEYENDVCRWCGRKGPLAAYFAWATGNGVAGAWNAKDADGIANVFRYLFNRPTGAFDDTPMLSIEVAADGHLVARTPPVANMNGFKCSLSAADDPEWTVETTGYALPPSGEIDLPGEPPPAGAATRFFRLEAKPEE